MTGRSKSSALSTLRLIVSTEGLPGLFRGNGASCLRIVPYAAIHFSAYEAYRRILVEHLTPPHHHHQHQPRTQTQTQPAPAVAAVGATHGGNDGGGPAASPGVGSELAAAAPASRRATGGAGGSGARSGGAGAGPAEGLCDLRPVVEAAAAPVLRAASQHPHPRHLGEDVPPTPLSSSIEVSATAVITTVEEEAREEQGLAAAAASPQAPGPVAAVGLHEPRQRPGPLLDLVAGSAAGATAVLMTYPLDMVRTRLAWAMDGASRRTTLGAPAPGAAVAAAVAATSAAGVSTGASTAAAAAAAAGSPPAHHVRIVPMLVHTARHEGVLGLYRGLAPTLYGIMPYAGLKFFVYGSLKQWYRDSLQPPAAAAAGKGSGGERLPVPYMLAFGGLSGLLAQTVTYPLDVIRRRMQVHGAQQEAAAAATVAAAVTAAVDSAAAAPPERLTTWGVGRTIARQDGLRGLFRGLSLNYVKVVPSTAIGFTVYDMFKSYLGVMGNI